MIPVFKPYYDGTEIEYLRSVFESAWLGLGPKTKEFEKRFAELIGVEYAIGLNSATAALHLAFEYYKIAGKEVITTPITFVSTNHAILYNNGIPKFCDVEGDTMNIDAHKIEEFITEKTAGIVVVHYGGRSCDMDHIKHIADRYNLFLIEDCSHATGGKFKDQPLGSIGNVGCFSFHAVKNLTT